jgi:predicted nucleotidyltransferase
MVRTWEQFEQVRSGLLGRRERDFAAGRLPHRVLFRSRLEVDLVPFGALMEADGTIRWPPDGEVQMSVLGFEDAYEAATDMVLGTESVRVVTLAGLSLLKLFAWNDSHGRTKDAEDLAFVARRYPDVPGHEDRLWRGADADLAEKPGFDYERAGVRLLGRDLARTVRRRQVRRTLDEILRRETECLPYDLATAMGRSLGGFIEQAVDLLSSLREGVSDIAPTRCAGEPEEHS